MLYFGPQINILLYQNFVTEGRRRHLNLKELIDPHNIPVATKRLSQSTTFMTL